MQSRQPKGIPSGGQFARNVYDEASGSLPPFIGTQTPLREVVKLSWRQNIAESRARLRAFESTYTYSTDTEVQRERHAEYERLRRECSDGVDRFIDDINRWGATGLPPFLRKIVWKRHWGRVIE